MYVNKNMAQSQLLQRHTQLGGLPSVQKRKEVSKLEEPESEKKVIGNEKEKLQQVTESMNDILKPLKTSLKFELHEKLEEYYVTIVNVKTNEVIKEIPSKKMLDLYASIAESLGLIVDDKI